MIARLRKLGAFYVGLMIGTVSGGLAVAFFMVTGTAAILGMCQ